MRRKFSECFDAMQCNGSVKVQSMISQAGQRGAFESAKLNYLIKTSTALCDLTEIWLNLKNILLLQWIAQSSFNSYLDIFVQIVFEVSSNSNITEITKKCELPQF